MFDSVREELQSKITSGRLSPRPEAFSEPTPVIVKPVTFAPALQASVPLVPTKIPNPVALPVFAGGGVAATAVAVAQPREKAREKAVPTADLVTPKTSPTLVGFQSSNPTLPDWRVKLQNAVQQRKGNAAGNTVVNGPILPATAAEPVRKPVAVPPAATPVESKPEISNPRVAAAMRRIEESRKTYAEPAKKPVLPKVVAKPYKFDVFNGPQTETTHTAQRVRTVPPPLQVVSPAQPVKRDTNKLPPISMRAVPVAEPTVFERSESREQSIHTTTPSEFSAINRIRIKADAEHYEAEPVVTSEQSEEIEDLAQVSMRFGAAFFDLIITGFASMLILSPIALTRGGWFSLAGMLTLAGVTAIVTFFYMTVCLGFYGKTLGMRLFSLELVDAVENEYPTLHQAAVSSSVFIISLLFGGAGFATMFFNEEKRAAHDLVSGTILVREF